MSYSWQGASGRWYEFDVARAARAWESTGGVYMFVKPHNQQELQWGGPICLFLAKADDFSAALARHSMWQSAQHLGAGEVHLLTVADPQLRVQVEKDLLEAQMPILNRQMRRVA